MQPDIVLDAERHYTRSRIAVAADFVVILAPGPAAFVVGMVLRV